MDSTAGLILLPITPVVLQLIEEVRAAFRERFPLGRMPLRLFGGISVVVCVFCSATLILSAWDGRLATTFA